MEDKKDEDSPHPFFYIKWNNKKPHLRFTSSAVIFIGVFSQGNYLPLHALIASKRAFTLLWESPLK